MQLLEKSDKLKVIIYKLVIMKKWITQIWVWEIFQLRILLKEWYSIPKVAEKLWRNKTTIYRLLINNWIKYNEIKYRYTWWKWWIKQNIDEYLKIAGKKKIQFNPNVLFLKRTNRKSIASKRYCRIKSWSKLEWFILEKIKQYWSPEQIGWRWKIETWQSLSKDTIYSHIYSNHRELISKYFRRKWKRYQNRRKEKHQLNDRKMIDLRPKIVESRTRIWDWEWDTVIWIRWWNKEVILTNVERKSWYLLAWKIKDKSWNSVLEETIKLFLNIPKYKRKTMTYDNWREFSEHKLIEYYTNLDIYFAHPYHSRERWTNENTNWLLRQFLPKKTDFQSVSKKQLQFYVNLINSRPRKRLHFLTPYEFFFNSKKVAFDFRL